MPELTATEFDADDFLAEAGLGRRIVKFKPKQAFGLPDLLYQLLLV
jgi:hypothetical protein